MMPTAAACPGLAAVWDPGWTPPGSEPIGVTLSVAIRCPTCRALFTRWEWRAGSMTHPGVPLVRVGKGAGQEVRVPALDQKAGMTAAELAAALDDAAPDVPPTVEVGWRSQVRALKFRR